MDGKPATRYHNWSGLCGQNTTIMKPFSCAKNNFLEAYTKQPKTLFCLQVGQVAFRITRKSLLTTLKNVHKTHSTITGFSTDEYVIITNIKL